MKEVQFGGGYYAAYEPEAVKMAKRPLSPRETFLYDLLKKHDKELQSRVERTFKQWNLIIRDYLRSETGLRLTVGEDHQAIPVRVLIGLPPPFLQLVNEIEDAAWRLYFHRSLLETGARALEMIDLDFHGLLNWEPLRPPPAEQNEIRRAKNFIDKLLKLLELLKLEEKIRTINQDILGAYFYNVPEIHLYWMVIGLIAVVLNVSVESLAFVVATHELAHAYTHMGRDIDGQRWDTPSFARTDIRIVEGMAQFYAQVICEKLEDRIPDAKKAYDLLLERQPDPYSAQKSWVSQDAAGGEIVRVSMIECRSNRIQDYAKFRETIERYREQIRRVNRLAKQSNH